MRTLALAVLFALSATAASAQIYAWQDANGTWVLSDRQLEPCARTLSGRLRAFSESKLKSTGRINLFPRAPYGQRSCGRVLLEPEPDSRAPSSPSHSSVTR